MAKTHRAPGAHNPDCTVSAGNTASRFDYTILPADLATDMRVAAARVQQLHRAAVIEVGRELIAIKDRLEHGQFVKWVACECQMPIRGAQRAMQAAEMVAKNDNLSYLPMDALVTLAGKSAPPLVKAQILGEIEDGGRPTGAEIKKRLAAGRRPDIRSESRQPDALVAILAVWSKQSLTDQDALFRALWNKLSAAQQATFRDSAFPNLPTGRDSQNASAVGVSPSIRSTRTGEFGLNTPSSEPPDANPAPAEAGPSVGRPPEESAPVQELALGEDDLAIDAVATADPAPQIGTAAIAAVSDAPGVAETGTLAEEMSFDRLETEFAALSAEQRALDRDWVMRRLVLGEHPSCNQTSGFLQLYIEAPPAEKAAFLAGRAAERVPQTA